MSYVTIMLLLLLNLLALWEEHGRRGGMRKLNIVERKLRFRRSHRVKRLLKRARESLTEDYLKAFEDYLSSIEFLTKKELAKRMAYVYFGEIDTECDDSYDDFGPYVSNVRCHLVNYVTKEFIEEMNLGIDEKVFDDISGDVYCTEGCVVRVFVPKGMFIFYKGDEPRVITCSKKSPYMFDEPGLPDNFEE